MTHQIEHHTAAVALPESQPELELLLEALHALDHALDEYIETDAAAIPAGD